MYIAVDIGGTKTLVASFDEAGTKLAAEKFPTDKDYDQFIPHLSETIARVHNSAEPIESVCIAVPGHIEDDTGVVKGFGNLDWKNKDVKADLSDHVASRIVIDNDANLATVGEAVMGAGQGKRKVLYVTVSTGIGTGVTVDGKIDPALRESEGGSLFLNHDGKEMQWEKFASGKAFLEEYHQQGKDVDDPDIWKEFASDLAEGFWDLISLVQPDIVIIGGSMGVHFSKYGEFLNQAVANFNTPVVDHPPIVQAKYPDDAVINGCLQVAKDYARSA